MGVCHEFRCPACGYEARVSGGPDMGMSCATQTILCKGCEVIGDIVTEQWEPMQFPEGGPHGKDAPLECPADASHDVVKWSAGGPCPKCGVVMEQGGEQLMWD